AQALADRELEPEARGPHSVGERIDEAGEDQQQRQLDRDVQRQLRRAPGTHRRAVEPAAEDDQHRGLEPGARVAAAHPLRGRFRAVLQDPAQAFDKDGSGHAKYSTVQSTTTTEPVKLNLPPAQKALTTSRSHRSRLLESRPALTVHPGQDSSMRPSLVAVPLGIALFFAGVWIGHRTAAAEATHPALPAPGSGSPSHDQDVARSIAALA